MQIKAILVSLAKKTTMPGAGEDIEWLTHPLLVGMKNNTVTLMALCCQVFKNLNM